MRTLIALSAVICLLTGCGDGLSRAPFRNPKMPVDRRVEDLLQRLTAPEKVAVLSNRGVARLSVPQIRLADWKKHATAFPSELAMAATWNPDLVGRQARVVAQEAISLGYDQVLGPVMNFGSYGEDPWLTSRLAIAYAGAMQGEGVIATAGPLNGEGDRRTLEEVHLAPFRATIEEAGVWSLLGGTAGAELLDGEVQEQWGFRGFVLGRDLALPGAGMAVAGNVDESLRRVLRILFISGIFDRAQGSEKLTVDSPDQRFVARVAAVQSIVLLKNDGALLPLDFGKVKKLALIGSGAEINRLTGPVVPEYSWKPADGIRERVGGRMQVGYAREGREALELAAKSDVAIVFGDDGALIEGVARVNRNTIVVRDSAGATGDWLGKVPAVLQTWSLGQEAGHAIADILFGDANPSGRLPVTLPKAGDTAEHGEGVFVGYRHFDRKGIEPAFAFGHGLSYSQFEYSDLSVSPASPRYGQLVTVRLHVKNAGARAGAEVVQLYLRDVKSGVERPLRELRGFRRVELKPGETKLVTLTLDRRSMWFYDPVVQDWAVEPGEFEVLVGASSRDIRLRGKFDLYE